MGKILTVYNLQKSMVIKVDWCYMCKKSGEAVDHLLLHCEIARTLWEDVFRRLELSWVMIATMIELLASWTNLGSIPHITTVWKMISICIL